jgi:Asp-tRNA(Asn)/Glu-tRNA(Gln) amidotransferase A subunit family amidase
LALPVNKSLASIELSRRRALAILAGSTAGGAAFGRALSALADHAAAITPEIVKQAEWIAGIELSDEERKQLAGALADDARLWRELSQFKLDNSVQPSLVFQPVVPDRRDEPGGSLATRGHVEPIEIAAPKRPATDDALAFLPVTELAALVRTRQITGRELATLYIARLKRFDPALHCVVNLTEHLAMRQAEHADREIAAGRYRGPLHGIPWGAKDLVAYPGFPTTWGAKPFKNQSFATKATVAARLEEAGAVLAAKLSLGALAMGDRWFDVMTRNPWNKEQGSSGSSAGSASAVAAGLVGFALGSETLGSIVSPCRRCGATGLRPTFGRVSRHGCMTLAWSMDKIGPIARSVEDCALVFGAIHGADGIDASAVDHPFSWPSRRDLKSFTVGYFEQGAPADEREELRVLRDLGIRLMPIKLPDKLPVRALRIILSVEAAAAFDELTRQGVTDGLNEWPRIFKQARFVPAVAYVQANRIRSLLIREMEQALAAVDAYVGGDDLTITNLTGHPSVVLPNGMRERGGVETPGSLTFTGRLYGETELLAIAHAYQQSTGHHLRVPPMEKLVAETPPKQRKPPEP